MRADAPKINPIPVRLEPWESKAIKYLMEQTGLNQSEVLRVLVSEGIEHYKSRPSELVAALGNYRKLRVSLKTSQPAREHMNKIKDRLLAKRVKGKR